MKRISCVTHSLLVGFMLALSAPAHSADDRLQVTATSPITIPESVDGLKSDGAKTANPLDLIYSFGNDDERVTLYIYRATNPNAALWFERADSVLAYVFKSRGLGDATPVSQLTSPGSSQPNGLTRAYAMSGAHKSTAIGIVEINGWMVKIRSTSKELDVAGQQARVTKAVAALTTSGPVAKPHPLTLPEDCSGDQAQISLAELIEGEVIDKPKPEDVMMAGLMLAGHAVTIGGAEGSLAAMPASYCRAKLQDNTPLAALYRPKDSKTKGWTMLFADSGRSLSSVPMIDLEDGKSKARGILTVDHLDKTSAVFLLKGMADPNASIGIGAQFVATGKSGLVDMVYETKTIVLPSMK